MTKPTMIDALYSKIYYRVERNMQAGSHLQIENDLLLNYIVLVARNIAINIVFPI